MIAFKLLEDVQADLEKVKRNQNRLLDNFDVKDKTVESLLIELTDIQKELEDLEREIKHFI
jgi:predicted  nucleic acid-binding Zn-ribbon protein